MGLGFRAEGCRVWGFRLPGLGLFDFRGHTGGTGTVILLDAPPFRSPKSTQSKQEVYEL